MKKRSLKPLLFIILSLLVIGVGGTIAYYSSSAIFDNKFKTLPYSMQYTEQFESPSDWIPGTTTDKKVYINNLSEVPVVGRVSYEAFWNDKDGNTLPLILSDGSDVAIINFTETDKWFNVGNYYYYYKVIGANESSENSFIESVTFNENVVNSKNCTTNNNIYICEATGASYDGATYTLNVKIETIQSEAVGLDDWVDVRFKDDDNILLEPVVVEDIPTS